MFDLSSFDVKKNSELFGFCLFPPGLDLAMWLNASVADKNLAIHFSDNTPMKETSLPNTQVWANHNRSY